MVDQAFEYDEDIFRLCAVSPNKENGACLSLFASHQLHFKRLPYPSKRMKNSRMINFLESVSFIHTHNSMVNEKHFRVSLNQFSDCDQDELPLMMQSDSIDEIVVEEGEIEINDTWMESSRIRVIPGQILDESVQRLDDVKVNSNTGPVWISASNIRAYKTDRKDDKNGSIIASHDVLGDFVDDPIGKDWNQYLNWATGDNPDGVPIVHPSTDQASIDDIIVHIQ
jgi:hypothetical protein